MTTREEGLDRIREALDIHADGERRGVAKMTAAVEAVHVREHYVNVGPAYCAYCSRLEHEWHEWPCATVRALTEAGGRAALDAHDAEVRAETLREAADALAVDSSLTDSTRRPTEYADARDDERIDNVEWLRALADRGPVT